MRHFIPIWQTKVINSKGEVAFTVCTNEVRDEGDDVAVFEAMVRVGDLDDENIGPWLYDLDVWSGTVEEAWERHAKLVQRQTTEVGRLPESGRS